MSNIEGCLTNQGEENQTDKEVRVTERKRRRERGKKERKKGSAIVKN